MGIKKICVATDSRAEADILFWLMKEIQSDPDLELQTLVMGAHLSDSFGRTEKQMIENGFPVSERVETVVSEDGSAAVCKSVSLACAKIPDALLRLKPDCLIILGDRYEMFATAFCAYTMGVPIVHLHGGEVTFGATDEAYRHAITKMSTLHFTSTEMHKKRVMQLGEAKDTVFNFGAPGLDHLYRTTLLSKKELETRLNFSLDEEMAMMTYHPVTLENYAETEIKNVLAAIEECGIKTLFTKSNADASGRLINKQLEIFCAKNPQKYKLIDSLGSVGYMSCLKHFQLMIGNSSSGIIEAASFHLPVVNIGDRQKGRTREKNVIDVPCEKMKMIEAITRARTPKFKESCQKIVNPYAGAKPGKISWQIKEQIKRTHFTTEGRKKKFIDLPQESMG